MPDPTAYNTHSGDMNTDQATREECKTHFSPVNMNVFEVIDVDQNNDRIHEEWHQFKEAHSLNQQ